LGAVRLPSAAVVGEPVGAAVGEIVGEPVGAGVGEPVGAAVGEVVGEPVGAGVVGEPVGAATGSAVVGAGVTDNRRESSSETMALLSFHARISSARSDAAGTLLEVAEPTKSDMARAKRERFIMINFSIIWCREVEGG